MKAGENLVSQTLFRSQSVPETTVVPRSVLKTALGTKILAGSVIHRLSRLQLVQSLPPSIPSKRGRWLAGAPGGTRGAPRAPARASGAARGTPGACASTPRRAAAAPRTRTRCTSAADLDGGARADFAEPRSLDAYPFFLLQAQLRPESRWQRQNNARPDTETPDPRQALPAARGPESVDVLRAHHQNTADISAHHSKHR